MRLYGVPLDPRPLEERRAVLSRLDLSQATRIRISPAYDDGSALLAGVVAQRLSGVIAKRRGTPYRSGDSGGDWVRVAPHAPRAGAHAGPPATVPSGASPVPSTTSSRRPRHARRERTPQHDTLF